MSKPVKEIQEEIIDEFEILSGDLESTLFYIMELGEKLPPLDEEFQQDKYLIKGCQSKVWLMSKIENGLVFFSANSNTDVTKGLISLLIRVLSGQKADEIINADLFFIEKIGMNRIIGAQRSNGLSAMIKQMKLYAWALKTKTENVS